MVHCATSHRVQHFATVSLRATATVSGLPAHYPYYVFLTKVLSFLFYFVFYISTSSFLSAFGHLILFMLLILRALCSFFIAQRELCCFTSYCFDTCKSFQCCNLGVSSVGNRRIYAYLLILAYLPNKTYIYTYCVFFLYL